jgi:hypothetical protein
MKYLYADSQDQIDPSYNFEKDNHGDNRIIYITDQYAHEYFSEWGQKPYDGMLVSYETVFGEKKRYSDGQGLRFKTEGAAKYLRFNPHPIDAPLFGDCGAFSYADKEFPPYTPEEIALFYHSCGFTHGISVDHIIFSFSENNEVQPSKEDIRRFDITINNAQLFIDEVKRQNYKFTPVATIQAWNPESMAKAAKILLKMGYEYLAIGGLVPLKVQQIHAAVASVREAAPNCKLHLLGFTKENYIHEFIQYNITTFDSTSPLIRSFKDKRSNYWTDNFKYTAIRIPQWGQNTKLKKRIAAGQIDQKTAQDNEKWSLNQIRAIAGLNSSPSDEELLIALEEILQYNAYLDNNFPTTIEAYQQFSKNNIGGNAWQLSWNIRRTEDYKRTLKERPWLNCPCRVCQEAGVETLIFRGSNRNKRRGFHNLWWFYQHLQKCLSNKK